MPTNLLVGSKQAVFKPDDGGTAIELHKYLATVQDTLRPRLAVHEFLKVDGAEVEYMGQSPDTYRFAISFVGDNWRDQYLSLVARIGKSPKGVLTHPSFGNVRVACQGIDGAALDVARSINSIDVPIAFITDDVDTSRDQGAENTTQTTASLIPAAISDLIVQAAPFTSAAVVTTVAALATSAQSFADAAVAASEDGTTETNLATQLGTVAQDSEAASNAILADPANTGGAVAYEAVAACEYVAALCIDTATAYEASKPPLLQYTVASNTDVLTLASLLYGPQASARVSEILSLNRIANPYNITAGTVLLLSTPTLV